MRHRNAQRSRSVAVILTDLNEPKDRITVDELTNEKELSHNRYQETKPQSLKFSES